MTVAHDGTATAALLVRVRAGFLKDGTFAIFDQATYALSNFAVQLLLARWLDAKEYGEYAVAYSALLLLGTLHTAFITEPMLVMGPGRYAPRFQGYASVLALLHLGLGAILVATTAIFGGLLGAFGLMKYGRLAVAVSVSTVAILLLWQARRACYAQMQPATAAKAGLAYGVVLLPTLALVRHAGFLSPASAFLVMGTAGLPAVVLMARRLGLPARVRWSGGLARAVAGDHLAYGRWAAWTHGLQWLPQEIWPGVLALSGGLALSAGYRAVMNLLLPAMHVFNALGNVLLPWFVKASESGRLGRLSSSALWLFAAGGAIYGASIALLGGHLLRWLYLGRYDQDAGSLWLLALIPVFGGVQRVLGSALRAGDRIKDVVKGDIASALVVVVAALTWRKSWGVSAAILGTMVSLGVSTAVMAALYGRGGKVGRQVGVRTKSG